jgi:signal transduction histidine kinase
MSDMQRRISRALLGLAVAIVTVAGATALKAFLVDPVVDIKDPFALYIAAIAVTAWYDWRWASVSIALAVIAGKYFFVSPLHSWHVHSASDRWLLALFVGEAGLIAWLVARLEAARHVAAHAVAVRDRFVATVSHDLRSPLQTILAWAQTLLDRPDADGTRHTKGVRAIQRAVEQQQRLIEDLLDFSVAAQGRLQLRRHRVDLGPLVWSVVDAWAPQCEQRGLTLKAECAIDRVDVHGDEDRLRQVIGNLLANSIKFTARGGWIRVELLARARAAIIRVIDSGDGIDPAMLGRVFEPWQQEHPAGRDGVGLGLAITRHLVELHDGSIRARSDGKGRGTTIEIRLPLAA